MNASLDRFFQGLRQLAIGQGLAEMAMDHLRIERLGDECRLFGQVTRLRPEVAAADDDLDPGVVFRNVVGECEPVGIARHIDG